MSVAFNVRQYYMHDKISRKSINVISDIDLKYIIVDFLTNRRIFADIRYTGSNSVLFKIT